MTRHRSGQWSSSIMSFMPLLLVMMLLGMTTYMYAIQSAKTELHDFMSFIPGVSGPFDQQLQSANDLVGTSSLIGQVMAYPFDGNLRTDEKIRAYLMCRINGPPPCAFDNSRFEAIVDEVMPGRNYEFVINFQGEEIRADTFSGSNPSYNQAPSSFKTYLPMPGGYRAAVTLIIGGGDNDLRWE